jgi:uncharacterized Fe-S radical SAM superfamily protein PflX
MVRKKDLLKQIENLKETNNILVGKVSNLEKANKTLLEIVSKMDERVTFLWNQDQYKKNDMDSILDEWMNGAKEEGDDK